MEQTYKLKDLNEYANFTVLEYKAINSQFGESYLLTIRDEQNNVKKCFVNTKSLIKACQTRGCGFNFRTRCMNSFTKDGQTLNYMPVDILV